MMLTAITNRAASKARLLGVQGAKIGRLASTQAQSAADVSSATSGAECLERQAFLQEAAKNEPLQNSMAYALSFAQDDNDNGLSSSLFVSEPHSGMLRQLANSQDQLKKHASNAPATSDIRPVSNRKLPRTLQDALRPTHRQAIVITETQAPFRVVDVNKAWEGLCGYTYVESEGKTLGSLLKGPETNTATATALIAQLLRGEEAGAVLTNYTKTGRRFQNHLRVGPLVDESNKVTHFVGVLQEIPEGM